MIEGSYASMGGDQAFHFLGKRLSMRYGTICNCPTLTACFIVHFILVVRY